jgi:ATP-dependent Clp protease ATP-binding subunit ClpA
MISEQLEIIIQKAFDLARVNKHEFLTLEHLLIELCKDEDIKKFLKSKNVSYKFIVNDLNNYIETQLKTIIVSEDIKPSPSASFERVLKRAAQHVQSSGKKEVKSLNILVAMFSEKDSFAVYFLEKNNVTRLDLVSYISHKKSKNLNNTNNNTDDNEGEQEKEKNNIL